MNSDGGSNPSLSAFARRSFSVGGLRRTQSAFPFLKKLECDAPKLPAIAKASTDEKPRWVFLLESVLRSFDDLWWTKCASYLRDFPKFLYFTIIFNSVRLELSELGGQITKVLKSNIDRDTRAHLEETKARVAKILSASYVLPLK
jgi:hypothetical protein